MKPRLTPYRMAWALAAAFALLLLCLLAGCTRVQYVPMQTVLKDSIVFTRINIDSLVIKDSIYIDRGRDTVYKYVSSTRIEYKMLHDTAYIERTDSVAVPYPVERELTPWEKVSVKYGAWSMGLSVIVAAYAIYRIIKTRDNL